LSEEALGFAKTLISNKGSDEIVKKMSLKPHDIELIEEPEQWLNNSAYKEKANIVAQINVVNDTAERGVKLIQEYNSIITRDEDQNQYILKNFKDYKNMFTDTVIVAYYNHG